MSKWYQCDGKNSDVVLFSKVRLARNLSGFPFPHRMNKDIRRTVTKKIYATLKSSDVAGEFDIIDLSAKSDVDVKAYEEKLLISSMFEKMKDKSSFMLSKNEDISVMMCEEDHIRINAFAPGLDLEKAYEKADKIDDIFIKNLKIAFSQKLGFLTSSPVNLGTGMKPSVVLHLPALRQKNEIYPLSAMMAKLGCTLRELYPSGCGDIYVLSNTVSLGITEKEAITNLNEICSQIVSRERKSREELKENIVFEDKIFRTVGILKTARTLDSAEMLDSLSLVRLGVSLGYFDIDYKTIGDMMFTLRDAALTKSAEAQLNEPMRNKLRAKIVRQTLQNTCGAEE